MDPLARFLLFVALPAVVVFSLIEALVLARRTAYDWKAAGVSLLDLVGRTAVQIFVPLSLATPFIVLAYQHRLTTIALDGWTALLALFIGQEFCYYWFHRAAHRVRWFWCNHAVHHSPNQLNLSAAYRIGVLSRLTGSAVFYTPLVWLGFPPKIVFQMLSLNLLYQFWIHATWIPRLGWLEWVLNTPSSHRVHHAANLEYLDANYGGVLIVFDRLFGTYRAERDELPCRYGLVTPMSGYNPLRIEFHQWAALARDLVRARSLRAVAGHLFGPPGWKPDGEGDTTEDLRRRAAIQDPEVDARRPTVHAPVP
ncbi:MAG TPA: sterol desaturase family protein [Albitalea sp.]|uniref:sterol desaturase family protein n=1 Tax=Piscinibacter sp. TaxID=1903157 RepID=UPI002ED13757